MKFYETANVNFFVDIPNIWDRYCRYSEKKTWGYTPLNKVRTINYYRDFVGARMNPDMKRHALYLKELIWHDSRIAPWACLPYYYANGSRYIKLEQKGPLGFKCAEFPMNLREYKAKKAIIDLEKLQRKHKKWFQKRIKAECKKKSKKGRR